MTLSHIHWGFAPEIFQIFGLPIRYYGVLFVIGIFLSMHVLKWMFNREKIPLSNLDRLQFYGIIGILVGARLGHCILYDPAYYLSHPLEIVLPVVFPPEGGVRFTGYSGLASHGGTVGLLLTLFIFSQKTGYPMIASMDLLAIVCGLAAGFIRLANFTNSEIIGQPTDLPWAIIFERVDYLPRHPAQLYEMICYFSIFALMIYMYTNNKGREIGTGFFFGLLLILVFAARFCIEFLKENQVGFEEEMLLNMGQLLSIPFVLFGIGFLIYSKKLSAIN